MQAIRQVRNTHLRMLTVARSMSMEAAGLSGNRMWERPPRHKTICQLVSALKDDPHAWPAFQSPEWRETYRGMEIAPTHRTR